MSLFNENGFVYQKVHNRPKLVEYFKLIIYYHLSIQSSTVVKWDEDCDSKKEPDVIVALKLFLVVYRFVLREQFGPRLGFFC